MGEIRNSVELHALEMLKTRLLSIGEIRNELWDYFSKGLEYFEVPKKTVLTAKGDIEEYIYFVIDGSINNFIDYKGKEISTSFAFTNQFTCSISSFLEREPTVYCIKTLMDCKMLAIPYHHLEETYRIFPEFNKLGRIMMQILLVERRKRELGLLTLSAEERYRELINENPEYVLEIPLKYVASHLGITPESLSRIRSKVLSI